MLFWLLSHCSCTTNEGSEVMHSWRRWRRNTKYFVSSHFLWQRFLYPLLMICPFRFTVSWLVQNNGEIEWPAGTCLKEVSVQSLDHMVIPVPALAPLDTSKITIQLVSPAELGGFCTKWRLCTPSNIFFGGTCLNWFPFDSFNSETFLQQRSRVW